MKSIFYFLSLLVVGVSACSQPMDETKALAELSQQELLLNCRLSGIRDSISGQWDQVNQMLDEKLPPDMPAKEKANMLKVRNANLIRMFQSYEGLDQELKSTLEFTENMDLDLTRQITALKQELEVLEIRKMVVFEQIYKEKGEEEHAKIKSVYETMLEASCD